MFAPRNFALAVLLTLPLPTYSVSPSVGQETGILKKFKDKAQATKNYIKNASAKEWALIGAIGLASFYGFRLLSSRCANIAKESYYALRSRYSEELKVLEVLIILGHLAVELDRIESLEKTTNR